MLNVPEINSIVENRSNMVTRPFEITLLSVGALFIAIGSFLIWTRLPASLNDSTEPFASQMIGLLAIYYFITMLLFLFFSFGFFNGIESARKITVYYIIFGYALNSALVLVLPNVMSIVFVAPMFVVNAIILHYIVGQEARGFFRSVSNGAAIEPIRLTGLG